MLTLFEHLYLLGQPFLPYQLMRVRRDIKTLTALYPSPVRLLDVGARESHYTIGVSADIVLVDLPRETSLQYQLNLGVTDQLLAQLQNRRSNVREYLVQDFLGADLPVAAFDVVTAIEVIEHVRADQAFVRKASDLLRPGGAFYLTTPNGAAVSNRNPDHVRHYTAGELQALLLSVFSTATVKHGEIKTAWRNRGLQHVWKPNQPVTMAGSWMANLINRVENWCIVPTPLNSARLFATARKANAHAQIGRA